MEQNTWIELGDSIGSFVYDSIHIPGNLLNLVIIAALSAIFIKCFGIIKTENYSNSK